LVRAYRAGFSVREVARDFGVSQSTVHRWVKLASGQRLDRVDFHNKKTGTPQPRNKSSKRFEQDVLRIRKELKEKSILGHYGAESIRAEMIRRGEQSVPTSRTIANIVRRHGLTDQRTRIRRPAPPPGWYLPDLVKQKVELDSFDIVEGLYLFGGEEIQLLHGISLHGSLVHSVAKNTINTEITIQTLINHWKEFGLPK
jgi:transposase-like protein